MVTHISYSGTATSTPWGAFKSNGYIENDFIFADTTKTTLWGYKGNDTNITIPNSVTTITRYAFYRKKELENITIPNNVKTIESYAFQYVPHITYKGTASGSPWGANSIN